MYLTIKSKRNQRVEQYKPTQDDWCPNFPNNTVVVSLLTNMKFDGKVWHRVSVWGNDDCGMEREFYTKAARDEARRVYEEVIALPYVNMRTLKTMGFVSA